MPAKTADALDTGLGRAIRRRRTACGLSQVALGEAIGVSFQQVQKYERGANRVSFSTLHRIASALDCRVSDLTAGLETSAGAAYAPAPAMDHLLADPEACQLLETFAKIRSPRLRRAVLDLARNVSETG